MPGVAIPVERALWSSYSEGPKTMGALKAASCRTLGLLGAMALLLGCQGNPKLSAFKGPRTVQILYSGDVRGEVDPCG